MSYIETLKAFTDGTGNGLNVIKVMPESAIKFGSYEAAKRALAHIEGHGNPQEINPYSQFMAGGLGGMFSQYDPLSIFYYVDSAFPGPLWLTTFAQQAMCVSNRYFEISDAKQRGGERASGQCPYYLDGETDVHHWGLPLSISGSRYGTRRHVSLLRHRSWNF
jgi:hypothetical protein